MGAQAQHLRTERGGGNGEILRGPVLPLLPVVTAAPAEHDQDSLLVGEMEEGVGFELALEADGVEVHIADQAELVLQAGFIGAQQHVL